MLEVELTLHRALGDVRDPLEAARGLGEELDDLVLDEGRVDIEHHQVPGCYADTRSPLPTTVIPVSVTVNPRSRSRSASMPMRAPAST
ncbi:hypothetical protein GCM10025866_29660 [Naasia aerilata]|uniref:Uncharacterized protein n=1 Tax=Naasia aerilata TaxID=1162966 RepID=A0ABM8GFC1_9MICO|nr:hypothetical protein GCM10025866_29660 [Naasia aerilata]